MIIINFGWDCWLKSMERDLGQSFIFIHYPEPTVILYTKTNYLHSVVRCDGKRWSDFPCNESSRLTQCILYAHSARTTCDFGPSAKTHLCFPDLPWWPVENFHEVRPVASKINRITRIRYLVYQKLKDQLLVNSKASNKNNRLMISPLIKPWLIQPAILSNETKQIFL